MSFVENCNIYSKEVPVNDINGIINSDKFSRSYDDLYSGVTFWDTGWTVQAQAESMCLVVAMTECMDVISHIIVTNPVN